MQTGTKARSGNKRKASAYYDVRATGKDIHQNLLTLQIMREVGQPQTIRMIHKMINGRGFTIDLVSLRRCITNLAKTDPKGKWQNQFGKAMIKVSFEKPCPISKVTVGWYELIENQLPLFQ